MNRQSTPNWESFNVPEAVSRCVDRAVVDGLVDGAERRARIRTLARIAFDNATPPRYLFSGFIEELPEEPRYIDRVKDRFGYRPVIEPSKDIRPSLIAIVKRTALYCSPEEQESAFARMECFTKFIYDHELARNKKGILTTGQVAKIIGDIGTEIEITAFLKYVEQNPHFYKHHDGQIILTDMYPNGLPELLEIPRIKDVQAVLYDVLPHIRPNERGTFSRRAVLGALRGMGVEVSASQIEEVFKVFGSLDLVKPLPDYWYTFHDS